MSAPTGAGKTMMASYLAAQSQGPVLVLAHRQELIKQLRNAMAKSGANATAMTVQTAHRRLKTLEEHPELLIIDEAHHAAAKQWRDCIDFFKERNAKVLGVTATPERFDGRPLQGLFDHIVHGPSIGDLTEEGHLVPARVFSPTTLQLTKGKGKDYSMEKAGQELTRELAMGLKELPEHYQEHIAPHPAIAFCCTLEHAEKTAEMYRESGLRSAVVSGNSPDEYRQEVVQSVRSGGTDIICNCELWTEGVDVPALVGCILLRPTRSVALYLQMVGRVLRPHPGKKCAIVLDYVGNTQRHGLPTQPREWSLAGRPKRKANNLAKTCPRCFAAVCVSAQNCIYCGHRFEVKKQKKTIKECVVGDFIEISGEPSQPILEALKAKSSEELWKILNTTRNLSLAHAVAKVLGQNARKAWYYWRQNCGF